jgi:hypothetical protein
VRTERLKPVTVRVDERVWHRMEQLAAADKRPVANYLRVILSEHVAANAGESKRVAA